MGRNAPTFEILTRCVIGGLTVRVWSKSDAFRFGPDQRVKEAFRHAPVDATAIDIAKAIVLCGDFISAYEIIDAKGHGAFVRLEHP